MASSCSSVRINLLPPNPVVIALFTFVILTVFPVPTRPDPEPDDGRMPVPGSPRRPGSVPIGSWSDPVPVPGASGPILPGNPMMVPGAALPTFNGAGGLSGNGGSCEPITILMCKDVQYNETRMPNLLGHQTQEDAGNELQAFYPLVKVR